MIKRLTLLGKTYAERLRQLKGTPIDLAVGGVHFPTPDVALVDWTAHVRKPGARPSNRNADRSWTCSYPRSV